MNQENPQGPVLQRQSSTIPKMVETRHGAKTGVDEGFKPASKGRGTSLQPDHLYSSETVRLKTRKGRRSNTHKDKPSGSRPKKQQTSNNTPAATKPMSSPRKDDTDEASKHPTVPNVVKLASGKLVSVAFHSTGRFDPSLKRRDLGEHVET